MSRPVVLIPHAPGTNRDGDAAHAVHLAGGEARIVPLTRLQREQAQWDDADVLLLPGGFSYGDALGAGQRWALDLQLFFQEELATFVASGRRVLGICNGFQVLVKAGILPGGVTPRRVTLTHNASGHFECRWVYLRAEPRSTASWLRAVPAIHCPVAHGEGNVQVADGSTLAALDAQGLVTFRYADATGAPAEGRYPLNPNGSVGDIAGLCNAAGNVVGLMPHPENHILAAQSVNGGPLGLPLFQALLER